MRELGGEVVSAGLVDTEQGAREAGDLFAAAQVDLVLCHAVTYATSSTVLPVDPGGEGAGRCCSACSRRRRSTTPSIDTGEWLANCAACCVPEIAGALTRARIPYDTVAGTIDDDPRAWEKIGAWVRAAGRRAGAAARAASASWATPIPGMLDLYSDFTAVHAQLGAHVEVLEIDDLGARVRRGDRRGGRGQDRGDPRRCSRSPTRRRTRSPGRSTDEQLDWSARVAVGLDKLAADFELDGLTYYYRGSTTTRPSGSAPGVIVGNSLLTARGVLTSGEGDLKTNIAQLLLDRLGAGGSFTEYYALDFAEDFVLMGHDGPAHIAIAQEQPTLRALKLFHGKRGAGLSVEFKVRYGPVTIVGCTQTAEGRLKLIVAEGESIPGETFRIGNTNSRLRFALPPAEFFEAWCEHGPTHHVALGVGHVAARGARGRALLGPRVRAGRLTWNASAFSCTSGPSGSTSTRAPPAVWPEMLDALRAHRLDATTRCSCATTGCSIGYLETEDFDAAAAGDGGDATSTRAGRPRWRRSSITASCEFERLDEVFHLD